MKQRLNYPICVGGENACPPEDCGGIHGFEELKKTLTGKDSEEKDEMLAWMGGFYNPKTFDPNFVNKHFLWGGRHRVWRCFPSTGTQTRG